MSHILCQAEQPLQGMEKGKGKDQKDIGKLLKGTKKDIKTLTLNLESFRSYIIGKDSAGKMVPEGSCAKKKSGITSRNGDRKIKQSFRIMC